MRLCSCGDDGLIRGWKWKEFTESEIPVSTQVCFYCHTVNVFSELSSFIDIFRGPWGALSPIPENDAIALGTQDASIFSAAGDSCAYCWDVAYKLYPDCFVTIQETTKIKTAFKGHLDYLHCIVPATLPTRKLSQKLSPGYCLQEVITGSEDGTARIWGTSCGSEPFLSLFDLNGKILSRIPCAPQSAFSVSLHSSGVTAIGGYGGLVDVISQVRSHYCTFRCSRA
ncbi:unnamed protein product [Linum tenue]|uniref:Uncharacterized protein n=1 Tax=Linum tenue TaxID=586396 RepID=A0AAV0HQY6_9ROSI|nr:unnamed protein product [Linum tenue]